MNSKEKSKLKTKRTIKSYYVLPIIILISICFLGIGYGAMQLSLKINGTLGLTGQTGVFITDMTYTSSVNADQNDFQIKSMYQTVLESSLKLGNTTDSSITYGITIINKTSMDYYYEGMLHDKDFYKDSNGNVIYNSDIVFSVSGIETGDILKKGNSVNFNITFKYKSGLTEVTNTTFNSIIQFLFIPVDSLNITPLMDDEQMTPVKYNSSTGTWVEADITKQGDWYDYSQKKWANAETENGYYVYVPRYAYKITSGYHQALADKGTIAIVFLNKDNTIKSTIDSEGNAVSQSDIVSSSQVNSDQEGTGINATTKYIVHPAFEAFGNVDGLWVAKHEASMEETTDGGKTWNEVTTSSVANNDILISNNQNKRITSKTNRKQWTFIKVSNMFDNAYNMNRSLDSHMMKNTEWGAVTYLAISKYGINSAIEMNKYGDKKTGGGLNESQSTGNASTTGNMYGIFDIAGGAVEYLAAYSNDTCMQAGGSNYENNKSLVNAESKYKDVYTYASNPYTANSLKVGDALYEIIGYSLDGNIAWFYNFIRHVGLYQRNRSFTCN